MRGSLILLTLAVVVASAYNAINLAAISRGLAVWGLVFAVAVPVVSIGQAWYLARKETGPIKLRPSSLILTGVLLTQAAMMPIAERLREYTEAHGQSPR